jgi:predicted dehydrogenase
MAISLGEARRMIAACEASNTRLVISHQRRFTPGWEKGRELVQGGAVGVPLWANCKVINGLLNCGTHAIDGARFVLGDPKAEWVMGAVSRYSERFERATPIEDACMALVQMEGGLQLFIQSDLYIEPESGDGASRFQIRGNEGIIDVWVNKVRLFHSGNGWEEVPLRVPEKEVRVGGGPTNGELTRELIAWIEGGPVHRGAGPMALATVEIMMALYESARRHHLIHLPLVEEANPLALMIAEGGLPPDKPGRYDIREFLRRDYLDQDLYQQLRGQGLKHAEALEQVKKQG